MQFHNMPGGVVMPELNSLCSKAKRGLISAWCAANLFIVVYLNVPVEWREGFWKQVRAPLPPQAAWRVEIAEWRVRCYAHILGIDNRWMMFGFQSRFNWWYVIRGEYSDGVTTRLVDLPLPNQSGRSLWQRATMDVKQNKFELNLYANQPARESYSRYIARQFPNYAGLPIKAVRWDLGHQPILPPQEARQKQQLWDPHCGTQLLDRFEIPTPPPTLASVVR